MCKSCWDRYGSPRCQSPQVLAMAVALKDFAAEWYSHNLHILVEDWNMSDTHLEYCRDSIAKNETGSTSPLLAAETKLVDMLAALAFRERLAAFAIFEGYFIPDADDSARMDALEALLRNDGTMQASLSIRDPQGHFVATASFDPMDGEPRQWCIEINGGTRTHAPDLRAAIDAFRAGPIRKTIVEISGVDELDAEDEDGEDEE